MILRTKIVKLSLFAGLLLGLVSCGSSKSSDDDDTPCAGANSIVAEANYTSLWTNVFAGRCGTCHGAAATGTVDGPNLQTKASFLPALLGKTIADYPKWFEGNLTLGDCSTTPFINSGSASQSVVVAILDPSVTLSGCTPKPHKDPPQNICISNGSLANLKKWIDAGASE